MNTPGPMTEEEWQGLEDALPEYVVTKAHVEDARADLLAAVRVVAERVWDEGFEAGHQFARAVNPGWPKTPVNPYQPEDL